MNIQEREEKVNLAIEIAIKVGMIALIIYLSYMIAKPFITIVVWGIIIAVGMNPLVNMLEKRFGHRKKIIIAITVAVIAGMILPTYSLSGKTIETSTHLIKKLEDGDITIPPPTEKVKEWPVIGEKPYVLWNDASHNLKKTLAPFQRYQEGSYDAPLLPRGTDRYDTHARGIHGHRRGISHRKRRFGEILQRYLPASHGRQG